MSIRTTMSVVAAALVALFLAALAPAGAAAHGAAPHAHAAKHANDAVLVNKAAAAVPAELRIWAPAALDHQTDTDCSDRGCCSAGHCSGCGTALAPASWLGLHRPSDILVLGPDAAQPAGLAREGPPRPPKFFA